MTLRKRAPTPAVLRSRRPNSWKMQDAKAQFSRVVRLAREKGPQRVTYRGQDAVVVLDAREYDRIRRRGKQPSLYEIMQASPLAKHDINIEFEGVKSPVRDFEF
jgi:prevent-host-death family protein